jgi:RNA polymerase sigma factor (sigma-70 family)
MSPFGLVCSHVSLPDRNGSILKMRNDLPTNLTGLANEAQYDPEKAREFLAAVYEILRGIARRQVNKRPEAGEGATEVIHEVVGDILTLSTPTKFENRRHVIGGFAVRIRNKITDLAKRRRRGKRGGTAAHVPLDSPAALDAASPAHDALEIAAVGEAFALLQTQHPNAYQVLKLRNERYSVEEVADKLDVSPKTVIRWTKFGTAFLYGRLSGGGETRADQPHVEEGNERGNC